MSMSSPVNRNRPSWHNPVSVENNPVGNINETPMNIVRTGVILNTENYDECVSFYKEVFGLGILFQESQEHFRMTCFEFGGSYLMVETGGVADPAWLAGNQ